MYIVIPMAGQGKRFTDVGYDQPKPFIDVAGVPMIERVLRNLPHAEVVLVARREHREILARWTDRMEVPITTIYADRVTQGAACTVLMAAEPEHGYGTHTAVVDEDAELLVANADQWLDWSPEHFVDFSRRSGAAGVIPTFRASGVKWSYVSIGDDGEVTAVAEKVPISDQATCGVYWFRRAGDCWDAIRRMIAKDIRTNGEYYFAPCYNEVILDGRKVLAYPVPAMWGLGTPEDLQRALVHGPWGGHGPDGRTPEGWREV